MEDKGHRYQHKQFPAGTPVRIREEIRTLHSASPIAGKHGVATWGTWYLTFREVSQQISQVPVEVEGTVYLVEPECVEKR